MLFLSVCWCLYPFQGMWKRLLRPVGAAMLAGAVVVGGGAMLCLPPSVFLSVHSVLMACMTASLMQTMMNYRRSLQQPAVRGQPLRESILPPVRSMAQPLVMVMPMLYAGMLLGRVPAFEGLPVVLLLVAAAFVANVLAGVIALPMLRGKA